MKKNDNIGLLCKWLPRKGKLANNLRKSYNLYTGKSLTPKEFRKLLVSNSDTTEQKMCKGEWHNIEYSKIPSLCMARNSKTFSKNDTERFDEYKKSLKLNKTKINTGAIYPHDVLKTIKSGDIELANLQWNNLPNYVEKLSILPMVDTSSSMNSPISPNSKTTCLDISVSLGLYLSEKQSDKFKNCVLSFASDSTLSVISGTLYERFKKLRKLDWGGSTNLTKAFEEVATFAYNNNIPSSEFPEYIAVLSDMEFDNARYDHKEFKTTSQFIVELFAKYGYAVPKLIWWNIQSRSLENVPVRADADGNCLISGFSPSIMKSFMSGEHLTPEKMLYNTINDDIYDFVDGII